METKYREIASVDCLEKRKWKTFEKKWNECTERQVISHMKRYCKNEGETSDYITGDIIYEDEKYAIEFNDMIIENVKLYEKTTN